MPEPGAYGPLPSDFPRPRSLQAYVAVYLAAFVYWAAFLWYGGSSIFGWVPGFVVTYLAWRGSKIAWVAAVVAVAVYVVISAVEVQMATAPGGHHPVLHVIESVLALTMLILLSVPATRRFYDLEARAVAARR